MRDALALARYEEFSLWGAVIGYTLACVLVIIGTALRKRPDRTVLALMAGAVAVHTFSIGVRWVRLGHVPVGSVFEMLSANVWGLGLALAFGYLLFPRVRPAAAFGLPMIVLLMGWMLMVPAHDSVLPASYKNVWLFIHIGFIKLFLGCAFIALVMSCVVLARTGAWGLDRFSKMPNDPSLIELGYRFMGIAWIFDTLGIIAGAIWAQDAWGRYWSWDPLEVWSLITWLTIGFAVHFRSSFKISPLNSAWMVVAVWCAAFFTFFGVPFVSTTLHKGAI